MKKPDDATIKMIQAEMNSIINEVVGSDTSVAEQLIVTLMIAEICENTTGCPISLRRKMFEILYRYFSLLEGLEKK